MTYETIQKEHWGHYFDIVSKLSQGHHMLLEVVGQEIGDQIEEDWALSEGFSYDQEDDAIHVYTEDLEHLISRPQEVIAQEDNRLKSISIKSKDGVLQIIHFREPILIPH